MSISGDEIARKKRIADMLVSCHAILRDEYKRKALILEVVILGATLWITALSFAKDDINAMLTPFKLRPDLWIGLLSIIVFFLAIIQIRTDWRGLADSHQKAVDSYSELKREAIYLLSLGRILNDSEVMKIASLEEYAGSTSIHLPDNRFVELKRKHRLKVEVSKLLDTYPGASPTLIRIKIWFRDNFNSK